MSLRVEFLSGADAEVQEVQEVFSQFEEVPGDASRRDSGN